MATRSLIGKLNPDQTVTYIYCHFDGQPGYNGKILKDHYSDLEKVDQLLELGDLSSLGEDIDSCIAYGRDRGEEWTDAQRCDLKLYLGDNGVSYVYIFDRDSWTCYKAGNPDKPIDLYN